MFDYEPLTRSIQTVLDANNSQEMIGRILISAQKLIGAEAASIFLLNELEQILTLAAATNLTTEQMKQVKVPVGKGIAGWVAQHHKSVNITDASCDERFFAGIDKKTGFSTRGYLCVPMVAYDKVIGTLQLLNQTTGGTFSSEAQQMLQCFAALAALAIFKSRMYEAQLEKERLEVELNTAQTFQSRLVPSSIVPLNGYEIQSYYRVARTLGGDYYDAFPSRHGYIVTIADVSGKGPGAALWMSALANLMRFTAQREQSPLDTLSEIDHHFSSVFPFGVFITLFLGIIQDGELVYRNAGHLPILLSTKAGGCKQLPATGLPIGLNPDFPSTTERCVFPHGARLLLYTDGVTEATNRNGKMFEQERLEKIAVKYADQSNEAFFFALEKRLDAFTRGTEQSDDITVLVISRNEE
ncbi:MAG: SpoIIE family protein phosphatase [bacterium]|nr:SpoIIE family protein phosphatase [bacterium]